MAQITLQNGTATFTVNGQTPTDFDLTNTGTDQTITVTATHPNDPNCTKQVQVTVRVCPANGYEVEYEIDGVSQTPLLVQD